MKRLVVLVAIALTLSIFAGLGAVRIQNQADQRALENLGTKKVYVATTDIPARTTLRSALASGAISLQALPSKFLTPDSVTTISTDLLDQISQVQIKEGQPLYKSGFAPKATVKQKVSRSSLYPGMAVVSVEIPPQNRVGGYLLPGDIVNVFVTITTNTGVTSTRTVLSNVKILAIGAKALDGLTIAETTEITSDLITLLVNPSDVSNLLTGSEAGTLSLVLTQSDGKGLRR